jgi:23S rRNA (cytosine1962-C5)-methyltransferase
MTSQTSPANAPDLLPTVTVGRAGVRRLREGLCWVYRGDIQRGPEGGAARFVLAQDHRGAPLMVCLWASQGALALRRWGPPGTPTHLGEVKDRLHAALRLRARVLPGVTAVRLCHGEADRLPGLFVDRYANALVVQTACSAMEGLLGDVVEMLVEATGATVVVQRDDGSARDMEAMPRVAGVLRGSGSTLVYDERGVSFEADLLTGHKTGSYLDQRDNHARAGELAAGQCLDLFSCVGGFGLHMARRGELVVCVEQDPANAARLKHNASLNGLTAKVDVQEANAFDVARSLRAAKRRFETVVLDPPALAKRAGPVENALRGYFELNRRALQLCTPGGFFFTFSCSGRVTMELLEGVVREAAAATHRQVQLLERLHAGPDHPGLSGLPETEYLKGLLLRVR